MRYHLEEILGQHIPFRMFTNSKSPFNVIVMKYTTAERRLMIDIKEVHESYENLKISHVGFVHSENHPAEVFTKAKPFQALYSILLMAESLDNGSFRK